MLKKITKLAIVTIVTVILASSCTQKNSFEARIDGWGDETILMYYSNDGTERSIGGHEEILVAKDGFISYNLTTKDTLTVIFIAKTNIGFDDARSIKTIIYPGSRESITGTLHKDRLEYKSTGDRLFSEVSKFREELLPYYVAMDTLEYNYYMLRQKATKEDFKKMDGMIWNYLDTILLITSTYLKENPDNDASAIYALNAVDYCEALELIDILSERVRKGVYKKLLDKKHLSITNKNLARENARTVMSKPAPDFTLTSIDGTEITLNDYKGKWIVLDFWGSWCYPCLQDIPDLKVSYNKHKDKVVVIGVACNDTEKAWRKAVKKHDIPWINVIDRKESDQCVMIKYGVTRFPTKIIITPDQTIARIVTGKGSSFDADLDALLKLTSDLPVRSQND